MATLQQSSTSDTLYIGWYGTCPENQGESGSGGICNPFTLIESSDGSNSALSWRHSIFPETLADPPGPTNGFTIGQSEFFRSVKEVNNLSGALTAYDGTASQPFGLAGSQIKELVCGRCYYITLKPGNKTLDIPEFQFANQATSSYEYRITDTCDIDPGPQPDTCAASCSLNAEKTSAEIKIHWDKIGNTGSQSGLVSAIEVVFDNVVFEQFANTTPVGNNPVITSDWGGDSDSAIANGFKPWTGTFNDISLRDNGTLPTQDTTLFGLLSFGSQGAYPDLSTNDWTFQVPVASVNGNEPIISEVRAYDTSPAALKYDTGTC